MHLIYGERLDFTRADGEINIRSKPFKYGEDTVVRIAKIEL